jgi:hypothetical protein
MAGFAEMNFQELTLDAAYVAYERDVADVNHDGANDVVCVSEGDNVIRAFLAPDWALTTLVTPTGAYSWPRADDFKAVDLDGDGDADLVMRLGPAQGSDAAGIAAWFENRGSTGWLQRTIGVSSGYVKDICVADLDRDGRRDVVMRQDAETQIYFQEAGSWTTVTLAHAAHEGMEVADLDMDGDPDIVLNGFWFPTPDTPAAARSAANYTNRVIDAAWFNQTGDWTANSCKVGVGDFDGDGRHDVAFSHSERAGYAVAWYRSSTPAGGPWTKRTVAVVDYCHSLQAVDWDLDGDVDLLVGGMSQSQHRGLKLLLNTGGGTNWSEFVLQSEGSYSAETGDIDDDGDLDIVGIRNWDAAPTYLYRNNAAGGPSLDFWFHKQVSAAHVRTFGLCFPDADGDGNADIASGPFVYLNPGPPMTGAWTQVALPGSVHAFATLDADGDRWADLMAQKDNSGANRTDIYWLEAANAAGTAWSTPVLIGHVPRSEHPEGFQGYRVAQLIAGGRPEILINSPQGLYYFSPPALHPEDGTWPRTLIAANNSEEGVGVADMDGDGDLDVSFTRATPHEVRWARNPGDGSGGWSVYTIGTFPEADWPDRCEAADLNGDGRVDIVVTEENSGSAPDALACWWEQPAGGATNANWVRHTLATHYTLNSLDVADVDRDGQADVVLAEHRGTKRIMVWQNRGSGIFFEKRVGEGDESHLGGRLADLDADGDLDLASIAYDDFTKVHVWRNDSPSGVPTVAAPVLVPNGGVFDEPFAVTLTCSTPGAEIWFTLDGGDPTNQPPAALYSHAITVSSSLTLRARGFAADRRPSPIATAPFTGPKAKAPVLAPPGGTFGATQVVTISCSTTGATIRFTTNGLDPQQADAIYSGPLAVTDTTTVKARAFRSGLIPSDITAGVFTRFALGAVAHWRLDERFGRAAMDSSGNGHHGSVSGATWTTGQCDNALSFNGTDGHVVCGTWNVSGTALTICAWIKLDPEFVDNDARILSKAVGPQESDHWWMLSTTTVGEDRRLRVRLKADGSTITLIAASGHLALNTWLHAAAGYDGATMRLFLNGAQVGEAAKTGTLDTSEAAIWIGANPPTAYAPFGGIIDDVRLYNTAMAAGDIAAVMNDRPAADAPRLLELTRSASGTSSVTAVGSIGHTLFLQRATNLLSSDWEGIGTQGLTTTATVVFLDGSDLNRAFYRLLIE